MKLSMAAWLLKWRKRNRRKKKRNGKFLSIVCYWGNVGVQLYEIQTWVNVEKPDLFYHDEGYCMVKFQSESDTREILFVGPYNISNKPIILKQWTPNLDFKNRVSN